MRFATDSRYMTSETYYESLRPRIVAPPPSYKPAEKSVNFILVRLAPGTVDKSIRQLRSLNGISGIHPVYGEYDLVLIIREKKSLDKHLLLTNIRSIPGVLEVQTLVAAS